MEQFMVLTREIYWNVGSGAATLVPMYLLLMVALGVLVWGGWQRIKVYRLGKELHRYDELPRRVVEAICQVFSQVRVMRVIGAGTAHGLFFWGFFILFIGTSLIVLQADFTDPLFGVKFLKGALLPDLFLGPGSGRRRDDYHAHWPVCPPLFCTPGRT